MASDIVKMSRWDPIQKSFADLSIAGEYRPRRSSVHIRPLYSRVSKNSTYATFETFETPKTEHQEIRRKSRVEPDMAALAEKIKRFERMSVSK
ncbi:Oidioi.mRNA.OKI2018_I69.PAR.g8777.t1.cds [Oikopleura dioica]|uniref:Oidioi.mRNA.OKI2018_I69.PAR.g8777.t1.cds n=1 Tax=Oikopleura dioica TaxID=34765 RepID=A0ABN7RQ00_OIKDI|nr:Oidioi.mRNA.OKI2018_I69.PAR.g8777.t1.cds [Oikopleura dioica]